jgi:hypothetical protein
MPELFRPESNVLLVGHLTSVLCFISARCEAREIGCVLAEDVHHSDEL